MIIIFGYPIGMLAFFIFSFLAGIFIFLNAIFGCKDETNKVRMARGVLGFLYTIITIFAFQQLETVNPQVQQLLPLLALLHKSQ